MINGSVVHLFKRRRVMCFQLPYRVCWNCKRKSNFEKAESGLRPSSSFSCVEFAVALWALALRTGQSRRGTDSVRGGTKLSMGSKCFPNDAMRAFKSKPVGGLRESRLLNFRICKSQINLKKKRSSLETLTSSVVKFRSVQSAAAAQVARCLGAQQPSAKSKCYWSGDRTSRLQQLPIRDGRIVFTNTFPQGHSRQFSM